MRYFTLYLFCFLIMNSCSKNSNEELDRSLFGEWQLIEQSISIGGPSRQESINNGPKFTLFTDGRFSGMDRFSCGEGNFISNETELVFNYNCDQIQEEFIYGFNWDGNDLILSPRSIICTDGCSFTFKKVD